MRDGLAGTLGDLATLLTAWGGLSVAAQKRLVASRWHGGAMTLLGLVNASVAEAVGEQIEALARIGGGLWPEPFVDGGSLIAMGLTPGPSFGRVLTAVYDAQLEGRVGTREDAEAMARELSAAGGVE